MPDAPRTEFRIARKSDRPDITIPPIIVEKGPDKAHPDGEKCTHDPHHDEPWEKTYAFHARGVLPGGVLLDVGASFSGDGSKQAAAIRDLFEVSIVDADKPAWAEFLRDADAPSLKELGDIADWLLEQYGDRPTTQSSDSSGG